MNDADQLKISNVSVKRTLTRIDSRSHVEIYYNSSHDKMVSKWH